MSSTPTRRCLGSNPQALSPCGIMVKHKIFIMKTVNDIAFQMLSSYIMDYNSVMDRAQRTDIARRKRGQNCYVSQLKVPNIEECYVINFIGKEKEFFIVMRYGNRYCLFCEYLTLTGDIGQGLIVLTRHFIDRYRVRNNMYASPMSSLLYDILSNLDSTQTKTERLGTAMSMKNGFVVPLEKNHIMYCGRFYQITVFKTCLSIQDYKVMQLHKKVVIVNQQFETRFGKEYMREHFSEGV